MRLIATDYSRVSHSIAELASIAKMYYEDKELTWDWDVREKVIRKFAEANMLLWGIAELGDELNSVLEDIERAAAKAKKEDNK